MKRLYSCPKFTIWLSSSSCHSTYTDSDDVWQESEGNNALVHYISLRNINGIEMLLFSVRVAVEFRTKEIYVCELPRKKFFLSSFSAVRNGHNGIDSWSAQIFTVWAPLVTTKSSCHFSMKKSNWIDAQTKTKIIYHLTSSCAGVCNCLCLFDWKLREWKKNLFAV